MFYLKGGMFWSAYVMMVIGLIVLNIVTGSVIGIVLMSVAAVWGIFNTVRTYKDAQRVGLMTRSEHKLEQRYEAELQSIWESK